MSVHRHINSPFNGLSQAVVRWFRKNQRALPFRTTTDPYAILVSELMLQQTQVQTVLPYYRRFLERFPNVHSLAQAPEDEVLTFWAGLGYYRRARLLQAAARMVVERHNGVFPQALGEIQQLPGVGRYTAGAVYSFAFNKPAPIVEANTARLLARLTALDVPVGSSAGTKRLWEAAEALLPPNDAREHNYALMELGALICRPVPRCETCPLPRWCKAYQEGRTTDIPVAAAKPEKLNRTFVGVVAQVGDLYLVRQVPAGEWHHGLFSFPAFPVEENTSTEYQQAHLQEVLAPVGRFGEMLPFSQVSYTVTRHRVTLHVYRCQFDPEKPLEAPYSLRRLAEIATLPLSSPQRKLLDLLQENDSFFGPLP